MTKRHRPEPTEDEVKKRLKEFGLKHREKYPVPPVNESEPEGFLAGDPDKIKERIDEVFGDDYGERKSKLKIVKKGGEK